MTAPHATDDDFTELADAQIDRVDLVGAPANGRGFVLMKAAADGGLTQPLIPREMVADLIAKADAQETPVTDPAPTVAKAEIDVTDAPAPDDLIPEAPGGTTANSLPGSADWEQLDGDTAMNAVAVLGRLKGVLGWLADREAQEAVTGSDGDASENVWDLDDMACSLDWMIGRLAAFAVGEHMEAEELETVGKAVAAVAKSLPVVEGLAPIAKAGRTLSAANESALRTAAASIETVLNSLPAAPAEDVTKTEETPAVTVAPEVVAAPERPSTPMFDALVKAARSLTAFDVISALALGGRTVDVSKAKGDPQMAVFSADGKLVGVIDPADLNPIAATEAPTEGDTEGAGDEPAADEAPADDAAAAPAADADSAVIPGTQTVQAPVQPDDTQTPAVAKTADPAQLEEFRKQVAEEVRKGLEAEMQELREQVRKIGQQPDDRNSPVLNGGPAQPGPYADLEKAAAEAKTGDERTRANAALAYHQIRDRFTR